LPTGNQRSGAELTHQTTHNIIAAFSFVAAGLNIALACYVLYKNPRRRENQLFAVLAFALAIWAFGDGAYNLSHTVRAWEFWVHFQAPGEILFPTLFVHLALVFTEPPWWKEGRARKPILAALYIPAAFALVAFYSTTWVFRFKPGPADTLTIKGWLYWGAGRATAAPGRLHDARALFAGT